MFRQSLFRVYAVRCKLRWYRLENNLMSVIFKIYGIKLRERPYTLSFWLEDRLL